MGCIEFFIICVGVGQYERTIKAHLNCAKSKVNFSNPH